MYPKSRLHLAQYLVSLSLVQGGVSLCAGVALAQQPNVTTTVIEDSRPVSKAIEILTAHYPVLITYEDPPYEYAQDLKDVTFMRKDLHLYKNGEAPRLLTPIGGVFNFDYVVSPGGADITDLDVTVQKILDAHAATGGAGKFAAERAGQWLHVTPRELKNKEGLWIERSSILDTRITIPAQEVDGDRMLVLITEAIKEVPVRVGTTPMNEFLSYHGLIEASDEPAQAVLARVLQEVDPRATWRLLYEPSPIEAIHGYYLNVLIVGGPQAPKFRAVERPPQPRPGDSTPAGPVVRTPSARN